MSIVDQLPLARKQLYQTTSIMFDENTSPRPNTYALAYAIALRSMLRTDQPDNAITIQCRYVLANLSHWRHPEAKAVRQALRDWIEAP